MRTFFAGNVLRDPGLLRLAGNPIFSTSKREANRRIISGMTFLINHAVPSLIKWMSQSVCRELIAKMLRMRIWLPIDIK